MKTSIEKPKRMFVTLRTLISMGACSGQRHLFCEIYNVSSEYTRVFITPENIARAIDRGMPIEWLMKRALVRPDYQEWLEGHIKINQRYYNTHMRYDTCLKRQGELAAQYLTEKWKDR
jgi:hypothetical protein